MSSPESSVKNSPWLLFIILLLTPISGIGVDISVPSLPFITQLFGSTNVLVGMSVSVYILGNGLSQVFYGMLSDVVGRRPVILWATAAFILVTLAIPLSQSIEMMLALRFIQGLSIGASAAISRAIVTDSYSFEGRKRVANYLTITWGIGPIVAPLIGGYFQEMFNWKYSYYFLALYGLLCVLAVLILLPETNRHRHSNFSISTRSVLHILKNPEFTTSALLAGLCISTLYIFNIFSSFIIIDDLGYSPITYGRILLLVGSAWIIGGLANRLFLHRFDFNPAVNGALIGALVVSLGTFLLPAAILNNIYLYCGVSFLVILASNIIFTRCLGVCLSLFPKMAGTAGALTGTIFIVFGAFWTFSSGFIDLSSVRHIFETLTGILICMLLLRLLSYRTTRNAKADDVILGSE
ncbi:multidrug effflux MFS transporter [Dongshaea marina]|uniref:multidrug effflux MFS transporter n=1 Tax=Dongshaea marina TaxID=2047966 RepID=UPI00131F0B86|nr:multidrug effflux MFS transporter [Dongshaea marina]